MDRRKFLNRSGQTFGSFMIAPGLIAACGDLVNPPLNGDSWESVRDQFDLDHSHIQMSQMLLASHPKSVQTAIERHRKAFDADPAIYWEENFIGQEKLVVQAAADYMNAKPAEIALTGSTTEGLAILYNGFRLEPGDEILTTTHDHYVTDMSLEYAAKKKGAFINRIDEFADPSQVTVDEVVTNIVNAINDRTRLISVTWVQSCTGVKLPVRAIADAIAAINQKRGKRIYFCVDGVHGFGNQDEDIPSLGCDFFCAGTHKWIFGPRGTGIVWGKEDAWDMVEPTIPAFRMYPFRTWMGVEPNVPKTFNEMITPGGFHAFEHRYALKEAFEFHMEIGRDRIHQRTTALNTALKEGIKELKRVKLHTPLDPELSAGINCFELPGKSADDTVKAFHDRGIIASASPYLVSYARLTPCVINTDEEVEKSLDAMHNMI